MATVVLRRVLPDDLVQLVTLHSLEERAATRVQAAARGLLARRWCAPRDGMGFVRVEGGALRMSSDGKVYGRDVARDLNCAAGAQEHARVAAAAQLAGAQGGNMANYTAAAQCYLKSLSLNPEASHIWGYLTMTLTSMGRPDLVAKAAAADHEAFRADFDF